MNAKAIKIQIGTKFGRLIVLSLHGPVGGHICWSCVCDCGQPFVARGSSLQVGSASSCGCKEIERRRDRIKHGHSRSGAETLTHKRWKAMKYRVSAKNKRGRSNYFDRGIIVCERWRNSYQLFLLDMGDCPGGMEIDRVNNDGNYEPGNCEWVTRLDNQRNRRVSINLTFRGVTKTLQGWAVELGKPYQNLRYRVQHGWSIEEALTL